MRGTGWLFRVGVLALALVPGLGLWRFAVSSTALPQWDMAKYGTLGLRLADAVRQLDPVGWLWEVHGMSTWPPVWPLVESAAFLAFGGEISVARGLGAVCWMLSVVAAFWAVRPLAPAVSGDVLGLLAAAWVAQAPLLQALSTVNLLEVPGVLALLVCLGCALRALEPALQSGPVQARWWRATWISGLVLFFLKYNYGLLWLFTLLLAERMRRQGGWRPLAVWASRRARTSHWTPWSGFVGVVLGLLLLIRVTGGIDLEIAGQRIRATSVGNPAYGLLILFCLRTLLRGRPAWRRLGRRWRVIDASWHGVLSLLAAPIFVWMLLPPHVKEFFGFVENRSSELGLGEALAFYPRVLVEQYSAGVWVGVAALGLAVVGLSRLASSDARHRLLALATLVSWLALLAHPYKLARFAAQAAVLTGLLAAAWLVSSWLGPSGLRSGWLTRWVPVPLPVAVAVSLSAALGVLWLGIDRDFVERQHELRTVPASQAAQADAAAQVALEGGILLGTWNEMSPALVEWRARQGASLAAGWQPVTTLDLDRRQRPDAVLRELDSEPCRPVGWIRSERPGWTAETGWLLPVIANLQGRRTALAPVEDLTVYDCPRIVD